MRRPSKRKLDDYAPAADPDPLRMRKPDPSTSGAASASRGAAAAASASGGAAAAASLHFFVRSTVGTLVIHARPGDPVGSVVDHISSLTGIPAHEQRLLYRGRQLSEQSSLADCGVETDSSVELTGRLRSTPFPRAWQVVGDLVSLVGCAAAQPYRCLREDKLILGLMMQFISLTPQDEDKTPGHLQVFLLADAPAALVKLYLSPHNSDLAERAIRLFLAGNDDYLPKSIHCQCGLIVLEFCKILAATAGRGDALYLACRSSFAEILDEREQRSCSRAAAGALIEDLLPFLTELGAAVVEGLRSESMAVESRDLTQFTSFLLSVRRAIWDWMDRAGPIPRVMYSSAHPQYKDWVVTVHALFLEILETTNQCLGNVAEFLEKKGVVHGETRLLVWGHILVVLTELNRFAKIFEGGGELLHEVMMSRRDALNFLIRRARRSEVSLRWLLKHKDVTDFESRQNLVLMLLPEGKDYGAMHEMLIDRSQLLAESFEYIGQAEAASLHAGIFMEFKNEEATGPGVLREWFCLLCRAIFNPQNILFVACPKDQRRVFPNPTSVVDPLHLKYFVFCGRVIALALMHKVKVGIVFDRVFFLQLAGRNISLEDVQDADPGLYTSCKAILEMEDHLVDSDTLGLTFVREFEELGTQRSVELCPGGKEIVVDSKNREEYVKLLIQHRFVTSISEQVSHFAQGFGDILTNSKFQNFFFQSLDLEDFDRMLGGSDSVIDVKEWKAHTEYNGYKAKDRQICWFWKIVEGMQPEQKRVLLFFWTSVKYLPIDGFRGLPSKLYIYKNSDSHDRLPSSSTCFHRLCLPPYPSITIMRDRLQLITQEHVSCSFGRY